MNLIQNRTFCKVQQTPVDVVKIDGQGAAPSNAHMLTYKQLIDKSCDEDRLITLGKPTIDLQIDLPSREVFLDLLQNKAKKKNIH